MLYSSDVVNDIRHGHWVCCHYDGEFIYIYDSLNSKRLHDNYKTFLQRLFPFYPVNEQSIRFPLVQRQQNNNDCGVFAIAFAVSAFLNKKPPKVVFNYDCMRPHLLKIFQDKHVTHFPTIDKSSTQKNLSQTNVSDNSITE